jgi:hypothetical protein
MLTLTNLQIRIKFVTGQPVIESTKRDYGTYGKNGINGKSIKFSFVPFFPYVPYSLFVLSIARLISFEDEQAPIFFMILVIANAHRLTALWQG